MSYKGSKQTFDGKAKGPIAAINVLDALISSDSEIIERNTPPQLTPIARLAGFT